MFIIDTIKEKTNIDSDLLKKIKIEEDEEKIIKIIKEINEKDDYKLGSNEWEDLVSKILFKIRNNSLIAEELFNRFERMSPELVRCGNEILRIRDKKIPEWVFIEVIQWEKYNKRLHNELEIVNIAFAVFSFKMNSNENLDGYCYSLSGKEGKKSYLLKKNPFNCISTEKINKDLKDLPSGRPATNHTERKIIIGLLNEIGKKVENYSISDNIISGKIFLYSLIPFCKSCQNIINNFMKILIRNYSENNNKIDLVAVSQLKSNQNPVKYQIFDSRQKNP